MSRKVRWGVISSANIAQRRFIPAILKSELAELLAIGSRSSDTAQALAGNFNIPRYYGSYQAMLDDPEIDAVYIPLPNAWHAEWTIKAADAGKHILCEKPMALDAEEAVAMADHSRDKGVLLMEAFMYRFNPRTLKIKKVIEQGLIGDLRTLYSEFSFTLEARHDSRLIPGKGAGSLMDVGCYCVNISRYLFGEEPAAALAAATHHPEIRCDMTQSAILEFQGGRTALMNSSFETGYRNSLVAAGTEGVLKVDKPFTPDEQGKIGFRVETRDGRIHTFEVDAVDQFLLEIDHFSRCVAEGKTPMLDPYAEAVANARVIDAIRESTELGGKAAVSRTI